MSEFSIKPNQFHKSDVPSRHLYVAGAGDALKTPRDAIAKIFAAYGELDESFPDGAGVYFPSGMRFCYVTYKNAESAQMALDDLSKGLPLPELGGSRVFVKFASFTGVLLTAPEPECTSTTDDVFVEGVHVFENFISEEEEREFMDSIGSEDGPWLDTLTRRIQHYGVLFNYKTLMLDYSREIEPMPAFLQPWLNRIHSRLAEIYRNFPLTTASTKHVDESAVPLNPGELYKEPVPFTQLTVNEYFPGQGISAHVGEIPSNCSVFIVAFIYFSFKLCT